jgi:hypothetical protein
MNKHRQNDISHVKSVSEIIPNGTTPVFLTAVLIMVDVFEGCRQANCYRRFERTFRIFFRIWQSVNFDLGSLVSRHMLHHGQSGAEVKEDVIKDVMRK